MIDGSAWVLVTAGAFVGTHFILSHPLRRPLVAVLGEAGFAVFYSAIAALSLGATVWAYRAAPVTWPAWAVGDGLWAVATVVMLAASILLLGSLVRNPALAGGTTPAATAQARGVYAVTRHPMMWAFALWGACHILVFPIAKNVILSGAIILLALVGAALQDRKRASRDPQGWAAWQGRTSYWPFVAILQRRAAFGGVSSHAVAGGFLVWLVATWAHAPLTGWSAGIWRWLGG
ncbi:NnrU family protein [Labrys wisconsinensis]|uniref:Membrane protein n=1 Tax=Labrys wisconsinensis TaxID=425677 RepID=A0ABU0JF91_9HYPH|nr:NnrU family protein [Labrys wisconsinensis]MDQ0472943.1 putative membrane protein [Labrys wisconsinensis]